GPSPSRTSARKKFRASSARRLPGEGDRSATLIDNPPVPQTSHPQANERTATTATAATNAAGRRDAEHRRQDAEGPDPAPEAAGRVAGRPPRGGSGDGRGPRGRGGIAPPAPRSVRASR